VSNQNLENRNVNIIPYDNYVNIYIPKKHQKSYLKEKKAQESKHAVRNRSRRVEESDPNFENIRRERRSS
jgi:hypothetical protein